MGRLDGAWSDWFEGQIVQSKNKRTKIKVEVSDQAALHGKVAVNNLETVPNKKTASQTIANNKNMFRYDQQCSITTKRFKTVPVALFAGSTLGAGGS